MTDIEKLKNTFTEIGVEFKEQTALDEWGEDITTRAYDDECKFDTSIKLSNGIGYGGFECDFYFLNGKYQGHGVWE